VVLEAALIIKHNQFLGTSSCGSPIWDMMLWLLGQELLQLVLSGEQVRTSRLTNYQSKGQKQPPGKSLPMVDV
jgi:hypothetical protein